MTLKIAFLMLLKPRIQFKIAADVSVYKCDLTMITRLTVEVEMLTQVQP